MAYEEAQRLAQTATSLEPTTPTHWTVLGDVLLRANRPADARAAVERGLASVRAPEDRALLTGFLDSLDGARAHYLRGNALRAKGDLGGAIDADRVAIGVAPDPKLPGTHRALADALREQGEREAAIEAYLQAVEVDPDDVDARHSLATLLAKLPSDR